MPGSRYEITDAVLDALERGRKRKGWNHQQVADAAGVSKQLYSQIRKRKNKSSSKIVQLLRAVGEPEFLASPGLTDMDRELLSYFKQVENEAGSEAGPLVETFRKMCEGRVAVARASATPANDEEDRRRD